MRAKIKFPIRMKLLLLMTALVVVSIITYLTLAIKLFRDDKATLIYDLNASVVRTIGSEFRSDLDRYSSVSRLLAQGYQNPEWTRVLLSNESELLAFRLFETDGEKLTQIHSLDHEARYLEEKNLSPEVWRTWIQSVSVPALGNEPGKSATWFSSVFLAPDSPVVAYAESVRFEGATKPRVLLGFFRADRWWSTLKGQGVVTPFLVDGKGTLLLHPDPKAFANAREFSENPLVQQAVSSPLALELKSFSFQDKKYLGAYADVGKAGLKIIATVPEDQIFRASMRLVNKSLLFGLLIVTLALLLSIWVARSLTRPLSELLEATESVSKGRFASQLAVKSNDEVGDLSRAFNSMAENLDLLQKQLVESERHAAIGQVARGVGHEFGNILMRVFGKIDLALLDTKEEKTKAHLEIALQAIERARIILQNLKSYSKSSPVNEAPHTEKLSVSSIFDQTLTLIQHELKIGNVEVIRKYDETPSVAVDPVTLGQVFLNLLINAKQAMPEGGTLQVRITPDASGEGAKIVVQDSGTGIPAEILPKIFETAFSTKGDEGSGLGLAISKSIIEKQGGTITAASTPGSGATFTIVLGESHHG